jgi:hypothetical protein
VAVAAVAVIMDTTVVAAVGMVVKDMEEGIVVVTAVSNSYRC